jgi:DNA-binding NtrC family response regulator
VEDIVRNKHHVLIINAEPRIALRWEQALERAGYHMSCAEQAPSALQRLASEHVDAVIIDAPWCGMAGDELAQAVRQRWPEACVLILSGAELDGVPHAVETGLWLLPKSATTRLLKKCLEQLLPFSVASLPQHAPAEPAVWSDRGPVATAARQVSPRIDADVRPG